MIIFGRYSLSIGIEESHLKLCSPTIIIRKIIRRIIRGTPPSSSDDARMIAGDSGDLVYAVTLTVTRHINKSEIRIIIETEIFKALRNNNYVPNMFP